VSALELPDARRAERRWVIIGVVLAACLLVAQVAAGIAREAVSDELSTLERVRICLTERDTPFEEAAGDSIALSAARGALRAAVQGNSVTVALGSSETDAARVYASYVSVTTADVVRTRLERRRRVVFLWEREPTTAQREFMYLCTLDAQE
jgi:hypothetical protein